jgi:hypothetical protein
MTFSNSIYKRPLRTLALALVVCMGVQDLAFAAPDGGKAMRIALPRPTFGLGLPESVASVDVVRGNEEPRLFLIRDAHTNPSAQFNTARVLERLVDRERLSTVLTEGGSGDLSVAFLKKFGTPRARLETASAFLRRGEINGAEYLQITSGAEFAYRGVEEDALYERALSAYREVFKKRDGIRRELAEIRTTINFLKSRIFSRDLAFWVEQREKFERGERSEERRVGKECRSRWSPYH